MTGITVDELYELDGSEGGGGKLLRMPECLTLPSPIPDGETLDRLEGRSRAAENGRLAREAVAGWIEKDRTGGWSSDKTRAFLGTLRPPVELTEQIPALFTRLREMNEDPITYIQNRIVENERTVSIWLAWDHVSEHGIGVCERLTLHNLGYQAALNAIRRTDPEPAEVATVAAILPLTDTKGNPSEHWNNDLIAKVRAERQREG